MDQRKETEVIKGGDYRPTKVELVQLGERPGSTEGKIFDVDVSLARGERRRKVHLIHKVLDLPQTAGILVERHQAAKEAGLPVPATFRMSRDASGMLGILMTDLTEGKKNLFMESGYAVLNDNWRKILAETDFNHYFDPADPQDIGFLSKQATDKGIKLSVDSVGFILKPDGANKLFIFDFGWVLLGRELPEERYRFITEGPDLWDDKTEFVLTKKELYRSNIEVLRGEVQGMMEFKADPDQEL
ncbi:hypothetical protein HY383_04505 [Candidatus Daviesbacteria bacterium]|nr:hypothetical protein [Candidatus Daviesbacteria bacterium]